MNPNDFMGYPQGQQPQQPMQMPNFNPSMQMQPNFGKGLPNFNPSNMQMNRQNTMNQFQPMQFPGMPNPMNQMQPGGMTNPMAQPMNQNMMKQHNMMPPNGGSFGFPAPNNRHRSSLTGMPFNNQQMFPQMIQPQSGTQPPTSTLPSQSTGQPKKKRSSTTSSQANNNSTLPSNMPNISSNASSNNVSANGANNVQLTPSPNIDNISGSASSNTNITTPISSSIPEPTPEKTGSSGSSRGGGNKSGSGSSSQKHSSLMSNQPSVNNLSGMGSMGSMNNLTAMNSMSNMNMGMSSMSSLGNMGNISQMGSLNSMASMNNMPAMNMNMNMGMNMGMPMGGMNMNNMNQMNVMNGMNMMNGMNPMGLSGMSSMGNLSGMNSMGSNLTGMNSMGSMSGMGSMGNIGNMPSMTGISSSATNPTAPPPPSSSSTSTTTASSSIQQSIPPTSSSSSSQPQNQPNQPPNSQQSQNQPQSQQNQQQSQQQPIVNPITVPPQIQHGIAIQQYPSIVGSGGISPEISRMRNLLQKISEEKAELIFSLFDIHQPKKKNDKIKCFIKFMIEHFHPNWLLVTMNFLEQIDQSPPSFSLTPQPLSSTTSSSTINQPSSTTTTTTGTGMASASSSASGPASSSISLNLSANVYQKFKEPPLPAVFSRVKNCKPLFKNLILNQNRLEFNQKNCRKCIVIGSFISATEKVNIVNDNVSVFCDKNEIQPLSFGENENYYILFPEGSKVPQHFFVQITSQSNAFPPSFLTWFVCQFVEKKNAADVLLHLLSTAMPSTTQNEKVQIARTPMCKGCSFYAIHAIEDILNKGFALCPTCHANINLNDLIFDSKAAAPPQQIKIEENKDMKLGRIACSDALTSLMKPSHTEQDWKDILFNQGGLTPKEHIPLNYSNTYEFRKELSQFKDHSFT